jgi:preprotein translocase subunit YajC
MIRLASIAAESSQGEGSFIIGLLPIILLGAVFYFMLIRPQQKRARAQAQLIASIEEGDEVMTAGGLIGTVVEIDDESDIVTVEIAPGVHARMVRRAISQKLDEDEDVVDLDDADADDEPADDRGR